MSLALPIDPRDRIDFEPTQPPGLADGVAFAFGPHGVEEVCASTVDTDSMAFESCWRITQQGGTIQAMPAQGPQGGFPAAMATIVHLNHLPGEQIVTRKLDPRRWVFAWRIDEHRVAVAEANYREPRSEQTDADSALMRLICDTGIRAGRLETSEAVNDRSSTPLLADHPDLIDQLASDQRSARSSPGPVAAPALAVMRAGSAPFVQHMTHSHQREGDRVAPLAPNDGAAAIAGSRWSYRSLVMAVLSVYAGMAALIALSYRDTSALQAEAARLQARADATVRERVDETLARGDYGEVQFELDRLAALNHFNAAVVTNARGRTVAVAGEVRDVRMGDPLAPEVAATGRPLPLPTTGGSAQLVVWDVERAQSQHPLARSSTLLLGLGVCTAATVAAVFVARRQRRTDQA